MRQSLLFYDLNGKKDLIFPEKIPTNLIINILSFLLTGVIANGASDEKGLTTV
jgi:hypothetical protein